MITKIKSVDDVGNEEITYYPDIIDDSLQSDISNEDQFLTESIKRLDSKHQNILNQFIKNNNWSDNGKLKGADYQKNRRIASEAIESIRLNADSFSTAKPLSRAL